LTQKALGRRTLTMATKGDKMTNSHSKDQSPQKSETVTERMYGESLPARKKAANFANIEISEILESGYNTIWGRED
jgi:hypothetical protein